MKIKSIMVAVVFAFMASGCTNLDEEYYSVVPSSEYGQTPGEIKTIAGSAYASLRGFRDNTSNSYPCGEYVFLLNECVSDEACIPTRGADWDDGGRYRQAEYHQLTPGNPMLLSAWRYCYTGISTCNFVISSIEQAGLPAEDAAIAMAEIRGVRAYYYFLLMDWFGNVPLSISFTDLELPGTSTRAQIYEFVETELVEILPLLPADIQYARFTQNVCNTLLARLYINSEVFIGTPRWQDCIDACDKVEGYKLTPNTLDNFIKENQFSTEIIFAIPFDNKEGTKGNLLSSLTYHYNHAASVSASPTGYPWAVNGICGEPGVWSSFDASDPRRASMCEGIRYRVSNGEPILMDNGEVLNYTETIIDYENALQNEGVRLSKYKANEGDKEERDHDWVLMRYAEVIMMKAECLVRLGKAGEAAPLVSLITNRSKQGDAPTPITLEYLDKEYLREFLFEGERRTTNIRFGTFFQPKWMKPHVDAKEMGIYPIPESVLTSNTKLKQNPGY